VRAETLLRAAVTNNARWCDAVCRSHGHPRVNRELARWETAWAAGDPAARPAVVGYEHGEDLVAAGKG
jgi:hypothetical protein